MAIIDETTDAPNTAPTPYNINVGDVFRGAITAEEEHVALSFNLNGSNRLHTDLIAVDLTAGSYTVHFGSSASGNGTLDGAAIRIASNPTEFEQANVFSSLFRSTSSDDFTGSDALSLTFSSSGTYYFAVGVVGEATGTYQFAVTNSGESPAFTDGSTVVDPPADDTQLTGTEAADDLIGTSGAELLQGFGGTDTLVGADGDDTLEGGADSDVLNGSGGTDTALFTDNRDIYTLQLGSEINVVARGGTDGTDRLVEIENLQFADTSFDLSSYDDVAGLSSANFQEITEMYIAYFNRAPDAVGLMFWANAFATGTSLNEIAALFASSQEAQSTFPDGTATSVFVNTVYQNVFGRGPDAAGETFWSGVLDDGSVSRGEFILEVLRGASPTDQAYLDGRTDVGLYFGAILGMSNAADGQNVMSFYDGTQAGTNAAVAAADADYAEALATDGSGEFLIQLIGVVDNPFIA